MSDFDKNDGGRQDDFFDDVPQNTQQSGAGVPPAGGTPKGGAESKAKTKKIVNALVAAAAVVLAFVIGLYCARFFYDDGLRSLLWFKEQVQSEYYKDVSDEDFWQAALDGVSASLDPYSEYLTADEYDSVVNSNYGLMDGIGLSFFSGTNKVVRVALNSPAFYASKDADFPIETGLYVTGVGASEGALADVFGAEALADELSKYKSGDTVWLRFTVEEVSEASQLAEARSTAVAVKLNEYVESYVLYAADGKAWAYTYASSTDKGSWTDVSAYVSADEKVSGDAAYLKLVEFNAGAAEEFSRALEQFSADGKTNLLLDLRNNGGGSLSVLQKIASHLMKNAQQEHAPVLTAKYKSGRQDVFLSGGNDYGTYFSGKKIYAAANSNTASASEALLGAMISYGTISYSDIFLTDTPQTKLTESGIQKTWDGAAKTYGKGIMQSYFYNRGTGEAAKLTTAQIYWPNGVSIHDKGITTDDGAIAVRAESNGEYTDPELDEILRSIV